MIADICVMVRKEWKEMFLQHGGMRGGVLNQLILVALLGGFMPWMSGRTWLTDPFVPLAWTWLPILLSLSMVADAFAGERERHTLETLLASRLPDQTIVLGKLLAAILYGWSIAEAGLLLAVPTINLANPAPVWLFYSPQIFLGCLLFPLLTAGLMAGLGTLVSLRAASVRQAFQQLSIGMMVLFILPMIGLQFMPSAWKANLSAVFQGVDVAWMVILAGAGVLFLDVALAAAAIRRFRRMV
jgi:ABC-2 type transport system permease protein